jgi:acetyl esterase/lipase
VDHPHERQRLDVHTSGAPVGEPAPVVLFVHGGGFAGGDKHVPGTPMYDHIGAWAVRNGWVGVTMTYRLAPEHPWPAGAQDAAAAAGWVRANIGRAARPLRQPRDGGILAAKIKAITMSNERVSLPVRTRYPSKVEYE